MEHSEFLEWVAFYETEPWGESRLEIHAATLAAVIANVNRSKGKKIKASDFVIDWWHDGAKPEAMLAKFRAIDQTLSANNERAKIAKPKPGSGTDRRKT